MFYIFFMGYEPATEINWIELNCNRLDSIPSCDGQTDRRTDIIIVIIIVRAIHTRRAVKINWCNFCPTVFTLVSFYSKLLTLPYFSSHFRCRQPSVSVASVNDTHARHHPSMFIPTDRDVACRRYILTAPLLSVTCKTVNKTFMWRRQIARRSMWLSRHGLWGIVLGWVCFLACLLRKLL